MVSAITTHPLDPATFAARLVAARKAAGLTQHALAEAAGLHVSNIRRYEAGTNQPTIDALRNLALALATSTDQLLFDEHERQPDDELAHAFEAASTRLDPESRAHLKAALVGDANVDATVYTSEVLQRDVYGYDAPGNPVRVSHVTRWDSEVECFDYDARQRLVEAFTLAFPEPCPDPGAVHGGGGPAPYGDVYTVDAIGNITSFDGAGRSHGAVVSGCAAGTQAVKPHAVTGHGADTFSYDCNGALTSHTHVGVDAETVTYRWDQRQRLTTVASDVRGETVNTYDTSNNRVVRRDPDGTTTVYLGGTEIRYRPGSPATIQVARVYSGGRREFDGTLTFHAGNHQGSITATNSANGAARIRYTPYGDIRAGLNDTITDLDDRNFLNQPDDPNTNTTYLNNRHYLPTYGIFASVDPIAVVDDPASLNPYTYAGGNPVGYSDVSGFLRDCNCSHEIGYRSLMTQIDEVLGEYGDDETFLGEVAAEINTCTDPYTMNECRAYRGVADMDPYLSAVRYATNRLIGEGRRAGRIVEIDYGYWVPAPCSEVCMPGFGDDTGSYLTGVGDPDIAAGLALGDLGQGGGPMNALPSSNGRVSPLSATNTARAVEGGGLQIAEGNAGHIFRNAAGHLAEDTVANRAIIQAAADNGVLVRTSPQGVQTFRQLLPDGTEAWAEVYQGQITNGGVNIIPRSP